MSQTPYVLAIDLGGTKIAAAVFDLDHRRLCDVQSIPTMAKQKSAVTLTNLIRVSGQARHKAGVDGPPLAVGMGSPGPLDGAAGRLLETDTLPQLMHFNMGAFVRDELGAPLHLENDANCFTLGEALVGAGRGHANVVGVTLGTGFGCGIVIGGRLHSGTTGNAGEVAYCKVAGGTFDEMLSGAGVCAFYSRISGKVNGAAVPSAKELGEMADQGDQQAIETWRCYGAALGEALGMIAAVVDPSICVLGGSVSRRFELFRETLDQSLRSLLAPAAARGLQVTTAKLDQTAGVAGAAEYALQRHVAADGP